MVAYFVSPRLRTVRGFATAVASCLLLAGCATASRKSAYIPRNLSDRECIARAMYFESNRSSEDGMLAVGTVVMNRYEAGKYGKTVCAVVGAPRQFAPGVLEKQMTEPKSRERAMRVSGDVLNGKRHPTVGKAEFFHTAGYEPGYNNMRYVTIEGGNAFYEKVKKGESTGNLVRVARRGPADIDDLITVNQRTMVGQKAVPKLAPVEEAEGIYQPPVYAAPRMVAQRPGAVPRDRPRGDTARYRPGKTPTPTPPYQPPPPPAYEPQMAAEPVMPGPALGWQVGPQGHIY